jgi:hypothetical protein
MERIMVPHEAMNNPGFCPMLALMPLENDFELTSGLQDEGLPFFLLDDADGDEEDMSDDENFDDMDDDFDDDFDDEDDFEDDDYDDDEDFDYGEEGDYDDFDE